MDNESLSRRSFLRHTAIAAGGLSLGLPATANAASFDVNATNAAIGPITVFTKPLQFLSVREMVAVLKPLGLHPDLTIRKGGHVEPALVEKDLPFAVSIIRNAGLEVPTVVTEITDAGDAQTEIVLKILNKLGIRQYRTAFFPYDASLGVAKSLDVFRKRFAALAAMNKKYKVKGVYQNHSGLRLGGSVWDLWTVLKDGDPQWMGVQYDPKHACIEGAASWVHGFELVKDFVHSINVKDFHWEKRGEKWQQKQVPLGEGMVDFKKFFSLVKGYGLNVPVSLQLEYAMGGAEDGIKTLSISKEQVFGYVERDLQTLKAMLSGAGFA